MKKIIFGLLAICTFFGFFACDDYIDGIKDSVNHEVPILEGKIENPLTKEVRFHVPNFREMQDSYGAPITYTTYYIEGEHSKIPASGATEIQVTDCQLQAKNAVDKFKDFKGKYSFWLTGKYDYGGSGKTDPSNVLVLDFPE